MRRDAKLVVLHWDELAGSLSTGSLHSWEQDPTALKGTTGLYPLGPRVYTDPQVAIIPLFLNAFAICVLKFIEWLPTIFIRVIHVKVDSIMPPVLPELRRRNFIGIES